MSETLELLQNLGHDTAANILSHAKMFTEKPQIVQKWHVCISSPLIGQQNYSFDDFDSMRRELTKLGKLVLGKIHVYYGFELPVTSDASGHNLFVVDVDGNEVSITQGWTDRKPVNEGEFGQQTTKVNIDNLI